MASAKRRLERPVWAIHEDAMDIDSDVQAMEEDMAQMAFSEREPIRRGVPPGHRDLTLQALSLFDQRPGDEEEEDQKQPSSLRRGRDDDDEEPQRPAQRLRRNSPPPPLLARRLERDAAEAAEWERPKEQVRRLRAEPRSEEDPFSQLYEDDQLRNDFHLGEDWGGMVDHMDIADIENRVVSDRFRLAFRVCLDLCGRIEATKTIPQLVQELDAFRRTRGIPQYDPYRELAAPGTSFFVFAKRLPLSDSVQNHRRCPHYRSHEPMGATLDALVHVWIGIATKSLCTRVAWRGSLDLVDPSLPSILSFVPSLASVMDSHSR